MQKLETELAEMTKRRTRLNNNRAAARSALDTADAAQQKLLVEGDDENAGVANELQEAIDAATSDLVKLTKAVATLDASIAAAEQARAAALTAAQSEADAKATMVIVAKIDGMIDPWLSQTRLIAAELEKVNNAAYTSDPLAAYLRHLSDQIEAGLRSALSDLTIMVPQIASGAKKILLGPQPKAPAREAIIEPAATRVFSTKPIKWTAADGKLHTMCKMVDIDLPPAVAVRALALGAAMPIDSDVRREFAGTRPQSNPDAAVCVNLDQESNVVAAVAPNPQDDPQFIPYNRGPPRIAVIGEA